MIQNKCITILSIAAVLLVIQSSYVFAGNKKVMSVNAAKVLSSRALIESIYGLKIRATEEVVDMVANKFTGITETKTSSRINGVKYEDVIYDAEKDVAKVTASVSLDSITNIDGDVLDLRNKVFRRVAFATSTPSQAGPLKALRAAELDAYKQLAQRISGFTIESHTTVENFMLKSDLVRTKVLATLYLAELKEFGWDETGNAYVRMFLDIKSASDILGEEIIGEGDIVMVEGAGSQVDDFIKVQLNEKK